MVLTHQLYVKEMSDRSSLGILLFTFILLPLLVSFVYLPGLSGPFLLDDPINLAQLSERGGVVDWESAKQFIFSNVSGTLGRPVSMASFLLSDQYWPAHAYTFKLHNLLFHFLTGVLVFYFVYRLGLLARLTSGNSLLMASAISALWLVHPFNVSTVLYAVQRMTQLAAIFSLAACILYIIGRVKLVEQKNGLKWILFGALPCTALAVLSKENGILCLGYMLLIEFLFFRGKGANQNLKAMWALFFVLPLLALVLYFIWRFDATLQTYSTRDFSLKERLLTQPRVLWDYIHNIVSPRTLGTGLIHDDFPVSKSLFDPVTTLYAILGHTFLLIAGWVSRRKAPLVAIGVLFFYVGHLLESSVFPLEMYFEHRNYLPMVGVLLALFGLLNVIHGFISQSPIPGIPLFVFCILFVLSAFLTRQNSMIWGNTFDLMTHWATEHPDSLRMQRVYGQYLGEIPEWSSTGVDVLKDAYEKFPEDKSLLMAISVIECRSGLSMTVSPENILEDVDQASYHGGLLTIVKRFGEAFLFKGCGNDDDRIIVHQILHKLENASGMRGLQKADLLYTHGEFYARLGRLNEAIEMLDRAFEYQPIYFVPYRQAHFLASAGLYDDALEYVEKAYRADLERKRHWITPANTEKIEKLEAEIIHLKRETESAVTES